MDLISDDFIPVIQERTMPTEAIFNDLKDYIKSVVRDAGGKLDYCIVGTLCHQQFQGVFTWGELEQTFAAIQSEWDAKRVECNSLRASLDAGLNTNNPVL